MVDDDHPVQWAAWRKRAILEGLILKEPRSDSTPMADCGVSISYLQKLAELTAELADLTDDANFPTSSFITQVVLPATKAKKGRFFDLVPTGYIGKPHRAVVHASGACFLELAEQLAYSLRPDAEAVAEALPPLPPPVLQRQATGARASEKQPPAQRDPIDCFYVWIDCIAMPQVPTLHSTANLQLVRGMVKSCEAGAAVVIDRGMLVLSRTWCLYEMWVYVHYAHVTKLRMCLPEDVNVDDLMAFEQKIRQMDIAQRTDTRVPDDHAKIISDIKASAGVQKMQRSLQDSLIMSVRSTLRWSGSLHNLGLYAGLLLRCGELSRLQDILHNVPELGDDEKMLREITEVFMTYVETEDDELDEPAFSQVLIASGFDESESRDIYYKVNTDGGPGVGLDEFREWWVTSQRAEMQANKAPIKLTAESLAENLVRMANLMEREEEPELAALFQEYVDGIHEGRNLKPGAHLMASVLKGDWQSVSDSVAWHLHSHEWKEAASALHGVLMWNADALDCNPLEMMRPQDCATSADFFHLLADYLNQFGCMLRFQATCRQHSTYFAKFAEELQNARMITQLIQAGTSVASAMPQATQRLNHERFHVVRRMISLKYGEQQPVGHALIVEAEKSLASWMAGNRDVGKKVKGSLDDLGKDYFAQRSLNDSGDSAVLKVAKRAPTAGTGPNKHTATMASVLLQLGPDAVAWMQESAAAVAAAAAAAQEQPDGISTSPAAAAGSSRRETGFDDTDRSLVAAAAWRSSTLLGGIDGAPAGKTQAKRSALQLPASPTAAAAAAAAAAGGSSGARSSSGAGLFGYDVSALLSARGAFGTLQGHLSRPVRDSQQSPVRVPDPSSPLRPGSLTSNYSMLRHSRTQLEPVASSLASSGRLSMGKGSPLRSGGPRSLTRSHSLGLGEGATADTAAVLLASAGFGVDRAERAASPVPCSAPAARPSARPVPAQQHMRAAMRAASPNRPGDPSPGRRSNGGTGNDCMAAAAAMELPAVGGSGGGSSSAAASRASPPRVPPFKQGGRIGTSLPTLRTHT
ncbi:hypothetical protein FOA52_012496 [Chlamydomonas sp. UWO 241]|nr:hypothetical protein FOA52_012496 [Chlamydomonas sp. UWO 241]